MRTHLRRKHTQFVTGTTSSLKHSHPSSSSKKPPHSLHSTQPDLLNSPPSTHSQLTSPPFANSPTSFASLLSPLNTHPLTTFSPSTTTTQTQTSPHNTNFPTNSFRGYSRDSVSHNDEFINYAIGTNVPLKKFNTYATSSSGGVAKFSVYEDDVNNPHLQFTTYSDESTGRVNSFNSYVNEVNAGDWGFNSYGKNGKDLTNSFIIYAKDVNIVGSNFNGYSVDGNGGNDNFTSYGPDASTPVQRFFNYGVRENGGVKSFSSYRDQAIVGVDVFISYAKNSINEKVIFGNYGQISDGGSDSFTRYGEGANGQKIKFTTYGQDSNFKGYANKKGMSFADYRNSTTSLLVNNNGSMVKKGKFVNRGVELGKFFREKMLKEGIIMPMPDIRDKMPPRSFLPRSILSKIPFSSLKITQLKEIFHAFDNSSMERMLKAALRECERAPSVGETKKCVGSIEDMIDFVVSVLGRIVEPRTTQNVNGSKADILIGKVRGINGGMVTKSVSCHQSLYPYLLYYCHSVPKVRVYEADVLDPKTKTKINHGVAICHLDTSSWSATHGAFVALGPGPGKIEVCHWIYESHLTWTIADQK